MKHVHLCSPTNSTIFTNCCEVAILPHQACCPRCKEEVHPGKEATEHERDVSRWRMAYEPQRAAAQARNKRMSQP